MLTAPSRDWNVFKQIFAEHWDAFTQAHPRYQTAYYDDLVAKMLACGNPEQMGYVEYRCLQCGQGKHLVSMSCKSSLCLRCAKVYADNWVSQVSTMLHEGVIYRHIILTVPAMFRTTFYHNAAVLLSGLMRCGVQCMDDFLSTVRGKTLKEAILSCSIPMAAMASTIPICISSPPVGATIAKDNAGNMCEYVPYGLLRRKWQWHLLTMVRQTLKTAAIKQLVDACFTHVSQWAGDQCAKGDRAVPVSECGAVRRQICGESPDCGPADRSL